MIKEQNLGAIKNIINDIVDKMGMEAEIEIREQPETTVFNVRTPDSNMLIGQHGVNLAALQFICRIMAKKRMAENVDFIIDVDNYKKKKESYLRELAEKAGREASGGKVIILRPMTSYERRVIHAALTRVQGLETKSIGEEPNRAVVVKPVDQKMPHLEKITTEGEEYKILD